MKKGLLIVLVIFIMAPVALNGWSQALGAAGKAQTTCPVMGGAVNQDVFTDYQGKRVYFCCPACIDDFKKNPEKYLKKLAAEGVQLPPAGGK